MPAPRFLGARLDDEIVLLDPERGGLVRLTARAVQVWQACTAGARSGMRCPATPRVPHARRTMRDLAKAGVIRDVDGHWVAAPIRWV